ncbi:hypothetical protein MSAN_01388700 [Mycena sanguinolenta]|uniref:Uncharacterized protein n=1 Tax=Mycena sanguinolenta TaxID=230812 RepID=A0A8H7D0K6_9AGAR|nr:hypothetical protein MSAN_01388700 [Mycena sanguinolenta]
MSTAKPPTSSACIQAAIQKSIQLSTPTLRHYLDTFAISQWVTDVSDDVLERVCHAGELALDQCFLDQLCRFPVAETMKVQLFSAHTLALIVTNSDLNVELISERSAAEFIRIIFGVLFNRVDRHQLQRSFDDLFNPIITSTHMAFTAYNKQKDVDSKTQRRRKLADGDLERFASVRNSFRLLHSNGPPATAQLRLGLGPIGQAVATVSEFASREVDAFMGIARGCPAAFVTGFKLGLFPPVPLNVVPRASSPRSPSPNTSHSVLATPRRPSKPYLRASAPSPPSPQRRINHANCLRTVSQDRSSVASSSAIPRRRIYTTFSPPPLFSSSSGPNRTLVLNTGPSSRTPVLNTKPSSQI